jgi:hypothetical protein
MSIKLHAIHRTPYNSKESDINNQQDSNLTQNLIEIDSRRKQP